MALRDEIGVAAMARERLVDRDVGLDRCRSVAEHHDARGHHQSLLDVVRDEQRREPGPAVAIAPEPEPEPELMAVRLDLETEPVAVGDSIGFVFRMRVLDVVKRELCGYHSAGTGAVFAMAPANWRDATCRDAPLCAQKLPQAIDFNGCLRHYETIWKCEMVPGASSQSPHNSLLYNEKSSVWKTLRPTGRPTADVLLKTAPLVASSENLISAAAWTSDRDWPGTDCRVYTVGRLKPPFEVALGPGIRSPERTFDPSD